jgi:hypothetical protein
MTARRLAAERTRKPARKDRGHVKDVRRAEAHGRLAQGLGSGGRAGGTKSSGGRVARSAKSRRAARGGGRPVR